MPRRIAQRELRNQNAAIVDAVVGGEAFIVTRDGRPVAELRPLSSGQRQLVSKLDLIAVAQHGPHLDARAFRADLDRVSGQRLAE
jgi:antitoxin (DNA-binding transcriptional repressor) of toxin-antitoxin stability system